mgnify:CR=1 FL=1
MATRKTVFRVSNLRGQLCRGSEGEHTRNVKTKFKSHWGIIKKKGETNAVTPYKNASQLVI